MTNEKKEPEVKTEPITSKSFILSGKQLQVLLNYFYTRPYAEVNQLIPQMMALPVLESVKEVEK